MTFNDGRAEMSCLSTRSVWIREVTTMTLQCEDFAPVSSLRAISRITVIEQ